MITIHSQDETTFTNNGLGVLEPISCDVNITINGVWSLELEHPLSDEKIYDDDGVNKIAKNNIIKITNMNIVNEVTSSYQLFRIYDTVQTLSTIKAIAFPIALEATYDAIIEELKLDKMTATQALSQIMTYLRNHGVTKYTVESDYSQEGVVLRQKKGSWASTNLISAISGADDGSIINHWGGEVAYDNYKIIVNGMLGRKRITYNEAYYYTTAYWEANRRGQQYANYHFTKANLLPCFFAHELNAIVMMVSLESGGEDWLYSRIQSGGTYSEYFEPIEDTTYGLYKPCIHHFEFNYKGLHWYASKTYLDDNYSISCPEIDFPYQYNEHEHDIDNAKFLIDSANFQVIEDKYECRVGKNVTGLSVDTDISGVATRLYPVSEDNVRLKRTVEGVEVSYVDSDGEQGHIQDYPYVRSAFIKAPYKLVDTTWEGTVHTDTQIATHNAITALTEDVQAVAEELWQSLNEGLPWHSKWYEPEWIKSIMNDAIAQCQKDITANITHPTWKSVIQSCIKNGLNYIKDQDIPDFHWELVTGSTDVYCYTNGLRTIKDQYYYVDKRFCHFNEAGNYEPWEDISSMDWIQPKGSSAKKKYGDNQRYFARNTYVYTWNGNHQDGNTACEYWFDDDGYWDGVSETETEWDWHDEGTYWWFGESGATESDKNKYAHDCWLYIYRSTPALYYFDSKGHLDDSLTISMRDSQNRLIWDWREADQNDKYYFGSTDKNFHKVYIKDQWLKVDGEWRKFKTSSTPSEDGTLTDMKVLKNQFINLLSTNLASAIEDTITYHQNYLYDLLYTEMYQYCWELYDDGLDKPTINLTADIVELSKMKGYEDFAKFEQAHLGNDVQIHDYYHNVHRTERIVGLKYDCIREYNTEITIGAKSVYWEKIGGQMSTKQTGKKIETIEMGHTDTNNFEGLTAGVGINIDANGVISADNVVGDVFGGTEVSYDPSITTGTLLGTIYINGAGYGIYAESSGSDVSITPRLQSGTKVADYEIDGVSGSLYAPTPTTYTAGQNVSINNGVISATDTTYNDFAGSSHGLVPAVTTPSGKVLDDSGNWVNQSGGTTVVANPSGTATADLEKLQVGDSIYDVGLSEIITEPIQHDSSEWAKKNDYDRTRVQKSWSSETGSWWNFETRSDFENQDYHEEVVYKIPIPTTARKIRYRLETTTKNTYGNDMYMVVGLKTTLDTTNYAYTSDNDFIFKDKFTLFENTEYEGEIEIQPYAPMYLYVTTSGWNLNIYQLDIVEYTSATISVLDDLNDVDITSPVNGQVLTYDSNSGKWVNSNPSGGADDLTDLGDVNISSPSNGQVLSYDSASQKWINTTPSGGGGGSTISYGYDYPSVSGQDGDLYIGLDANNQKVAEYLYMVNQWVAIFGGFAPYTVLLSKSYRNSTAGSTYVASTAGVLICVNQNMNGEASTKTLTAGITTTGTVLYTDTYNPSWSSPNRNQCTTVSIIEVDVGDTITFSNSQNGNYTTQLHLVLSAMGTVDALSRVVSEAKSDNNFSSAQTYTVSSTGKYLAICFQCRGNGNGTKAVTLSSVPSGEVTKVFDATTNHSVSIEIIDVVNSGAFTFDWINQNDYATKGYCIYKIG